jgi:hypothetical protein
MDTSRMSQGHMVAGVGGVLLIVGLFLDWVSGLGNAFDAFSGMDIIMLIIGIVAIAWAASAGMGAATPPALSGMLPPRPRARRHRRPAPPSEQLLSLILRRAQCRPSGGAYLRGAGRTPATAVSG